MQTCLALMEYHCGNKDAPLASRIFEKAMELYGDEVEFVLRYLGFLISINDENSELTCSSVLDSCSQFSYSTQTRELCSNV